MINHLLQQKNQPNMANIQALPCWQGLSWQAQQADLITSVPTLLEVLKIDPDQVQGASRKAFGLRVPKQFVAKMAFGDSNDPLLKQVLPDPRETNQVIGYTNDPLKETKYNPVPGLLHKYKSRALITVTGACAVHCRYCFRQHFDYQDNQPQQWDKLKNYLNQHRHLNEVVLSGGDPLSVSNRRLFAWFDAIESVPHVHTIRLHTRLPVMIPERLDVELLTRMRASRCHVVVVLHANHANEIDANTVAHCRRLQQQGVLVLNQTVLLHQINDTADDLANLSQALFSAGVLPYYLHLLDPVAGAAHFEVDKAKATDLYWQLLADLPGYLVPKLVQELPDRPYKTPLNIYNSLNSEASTCVRS